MVVVVARICIRSFGDIQINLAYTRGGGAHRLIRRLMLYFHSLSVAKPFCSRETDESIVSSGESSTACLSPPPHLSPQAFIRTYSVVNNMDNIVELSFYESPYSSEQVR